MNIVIAGVGRYIDSIENVLKSDVNVLFYFDNDINKRNKERNGKKILSHYQCETKSVNYVIIAIMDYCAMKEELLECGFVESQIIPFFDMNLEVESYADIWDVNKSNLYRLTCTMDFLNRRIKEFAEVNKNYYEHYTYEIADKIVRKEVRLPKICSVEETCDKIISEKASMSRYGDGEFEIIFGAAKDIYQANDFDLAVRLKEILISDCSKHLVALADDYGCLEGLREQNKNCIRNYMTNAKREQHYRCLNMEKQYYNAYISRPYAIYPHEKLDEARVRFERLKQIWNGQNLLIIEGNKTRMGVGNDLLSGALTIERIIAPNENAFDVYDDILNAAYTYGKQKLILIALGPTATVLAYDLAMQGYWALDIGHLDLEYEWFLKGQGYSYIPNKYNNEMPGDDVVIELHDEEYDRSVIKRIER